MLFWKNYYTFFLQASTVIDDIMVHSKKKITILMSSEPTNHYYVKVNFLWLTIIQVSYILTSLEYKVLSPPHSLSYMSTHFNKIKLQCTSYTIFSFFLINFFFFKFAAFFLFKYSSDFTICFKFNKTIPNVFLWFR